MNNIQRKLLWLGIPVLIIVVVIALRFSFNRRTDSDGPAASSPNNTESPSSAPNGAEDASGLRYVVPGTSPISRAGVVLIDPESEEAALNNVLPGSPPAPLVSGPLDSESLSQEVIRIELSKGKASPNEFKVGFGQALTLAISATDGSRHVFRFEDPSLAAINVSLQPGETRAITFNAPSEPGEYTFFCDVPGHAARGEKGIMLVQ